MIRHSYIFKTWFEETKENYNIWKKTLEKMIKL